MDKKLRVLVCCGGGFSSYFMSSKVKDQIKEKGYQDKMEVTFCPFDMSHEHWDEVDVVMCCPHLFYQVPAYIERYGNKVPYYMIPSKMYGTMYIEDVYQDAMDVVNMYKESGNQMNPVYFPGEEAYHKIQRIHSYEREVRSKTKK
jgi:PTS system cellobiose-specific IIB component